MQKLQIWSNLMQKNEIHLYDYSLMIRQSIELRESLAFKVQPHDS